MIPVHTSKLIDSMQEMTTVVNDIAKAMSLSTGSQIVMTGGHPLHLHKGSNFVKVIDIDF